ncbi:transporter substrate-binding domain-containing protein [Microtetraspora malaysiensis]|uniref:transporter substrate-binding domain-containing protein n=1 Tax=Microtetraspora malaysiensis TaxID=161358 RepID=UPI003D89BF87
MVSRRVLAFVVAGCIPFTLSACTKAPADGGERVANAAVQPPKPYADTGVINLCSAFTNPPRIYQHDGERVGAEFELGTALAGELGLKINWTQYESSGLLSGLIGKRCDMLIDEFADRAERRDRVWWLPSSYAVTQVVVPKGNPKQIHSFEDMPGKKVGVPDGTLAQDMVVAWNKKIVAEGKAQIDVVTLPNTRDMFQQVAAKNLDAAVGTDSSAAYYGALANGGIESGGAGCTSGTTDDDRVGFLIRKEEPELFKAMEKAMANLRSNGSYQSIFEKHGLGSVTLDKFGDGKPPLCAPGVKL